MYNTVNSEYFGNAPKCPASHPVRVPQVTFETQWDTSKFNSLWPSGAPNPFVWSFEGQAGGTHADYLFGWKGDALQRAMDKSECFYDGCGSITKQSMAVANQCTVKTMVNDKVDGCKYLLRILTIIPPRLTCTRGRFAPGYGQNEDEYVVVFVSIGSSECWNLR